jgi:hypothetical protein
MVLLSLRLVQALLVLEWLVQVLLHQEQLVRVL